MTSQPFAIPELLLFIVAVPLVLGLMPRNRFYGVRTRKSLSDERIWYPLNRLVAAVIMVGSGVYGMVAALLPYDRSASDNFVIWAIHLAAFLVPLVIAVGMAIWYPKRL